MEGYRRKQIRSYIGHYFRHVCDFFATHMAALLNFDP